MTRRRGVYRPLTLLAGLCICALITVCLKARYVKGSEQKDGYTASVIVNNIETPISTLFEDYQQKRNITLVTAYFDLGRFEKGETGNVFYDPYMYRRWMAAFKYISSPVVAYLEDRLDVERFAAIRSSLPANLTRIIRVSRADTWAFSLHPSISRVFSQPSYPVHHPNTFNANYSCAMHAKYEFLANAVRLNPFNTKYFAWADIGYFREVLHWRTNSTSRLHLPPLFNDKTLAVNEVFTRHPNTTPTDIFHKNLVWLGGGFFVGTGKVMLKWTAQYRRAVNAFLQRMLMGTDQQVIYAWLNLGRNTVPIRTYRGDGRYNPWFHLGNICKD